MELVGSVTLYGDGNSPINITRHKLCVSDNEILQRRMHKSLSLLHLIRFWKMYDWPRDFPLT